MELVSTPGNPVPGEPAVMQVATQDGVILRVARWGSASQESARGTVCILQGRAEFIEKYFETIADLRRRGFAVAAFDWRGQGGSGRQVGDPRKGHVSTFDAYRRDLEAVWDQVLEPLMPKPYFGLAHSMGGAIALMGARDGWLPFERFVATAPMIALSLVQRTGLARNSAALLAALGFGQSFIPGGGGTSVLLRPFSGNLLTSDPQRYARNAEAAAAMGAGAIGDPTIGWVHAAFKVMGAFAEPRYPLEIHVPTLVVAAGLDGVCATPAIERFAARMKAGRAIVIPGSRHEILMERNAIREEFWAAFDAFVPGAGPDPAVSGRVQQGESRLMQPAVADGEN
jgi:lysophospholipase